CSALSWTKAQSYDTKDWSLLTTILAPTLSIDYSAIKGPSGLAPAQPALAFVAHISSPTELGNSDVKTQHLLGLARWMRLSGGEVTTVRQIRARHWNTATEDGVGATGHGTVQHWYSKGGETETETGMGKGAGMWWLSGLRPEITFWEGDMARVMGWMQ
ncbi:NTF2-like protein, partial [Setomelanomma holmii]